MNINLYNFNCHAKLRTELRLNFVLILQHSGFTSFYLTFKEVRKRNQETQNPIIWIWHKSSRTPKKHGVYLGAILGSEV